MGIIDRLYDWWKGVECHYDENCTYENHGIYWIRKCWCSRRMPEKRVNPGNNKTIDRKRGGVVEVIGTKYHGGTILDQIKQIGFGK